ncbi:MAG: anti-sigma factor antagonist [Lachnospiraceae bacterium]|nr:anti-sigma factor antagonist [Lachnospiraceae bacterium]
MAQEINGINEADLDKLREEVNPVYSTAQSCLQLVAATGDEDSENLRKILGFTRFGEDTKERGANVPPQIREALIKAVPVFNVQIEARFFASNNYIKASGAETVVDLPCGYTARGIKLAKSGVKYYGLDLPAVIDAMNPAVKEAIGDNENVRYCEIDATNYSSVRKALEGSEGKLHISTEGLLMYFTQPELETVFGNIRKLLLEFGGRWVTVDNELAKAQGKILSAITSSLPEEIASQIGNIAAGAVSKTTLANNVFFDSDMEKARTFVSDMGFDLEIVSIKDYMPETLIAIEKLPDEERETIKAALEEINFWVMTPRAGESDNFAHEEDNFKADLELNDNILKVALTGRLDTISSPGLLALYREAEAKGGITGICVDMKDLEYISSAGLRVLLIMRKALKGDNDFSLINVSDPIKEIIETTGFDTIFC